MPDPTAPRPETMKPEDVPDDLADNAVDAWHEAPRDEHGNRPLLDDLMRHILTAVLPTHTRRVREQVAADIDAERAGGTEHWAAAMDHAARIARGEGR